MFNNSFRSHQSPGIGNPWLNSTSSIAILIFSYNEPGVWYDPSDLTTLFQDVNALTPVTSPSQTVAVMLDKSKGSSFGANIAVNGDFSQGATGWILGVGVTVSGGVATVPSGSTWLEQLVPTQAGRAYRVTATVTGVNGSFCGTWNSLNQNGNLPLLSGGSSASGRNGTFSYTFIASGTTSYVGFTGGGGLSCTVDNVSVIPLPLGNHATQATSAQRPTYGFHPITGLRNLLRYSEQFDNAYWTKSNGSITPDVAVAPNGTSTADRLSWVSAVNAQVQAPSTTIPAGSTITLSTYAKAGTKSSLTLVMFTDGSNYVVVSFNLASGTVGTPIVLGTRYTSVQATATLVGDGWYRCAVKTVTNTLTTVESWLRGDTLIGSGDNILLWGAQLEVGATASAYQKVVTQYEVTEAGVASAYYIAFDGVDDGMVTSAINFSATDAVTVWAGVRKLSDTLRGSIVELGAGATGSFRLEAPGTNAAQNYAIAGGGSIVTGTTIGGIPSPDTSVITMIGLISGDLNALRRNGALASQSSADQGVGNYVAGQVTIGRRTGAVNPFNGNIYSLIVRGAESTAGQITSIESFTNRKTGAY
jgi:hypothetical protein